MIKVFTTKTCAYCAMVKQFLEKKGLPFEAIDLEDNPTLRQELLNKTGAMTVPITQIGDNYIVGWNPAKLMELTR
jgi:glutaredoxin 3